MKMIDIIYKKRNGEILTKEEINYFIHGYNEERVPDYQMSALLMAIYYKGMNKTETVNLTNAIIDSGDIIDLSLINGLKVDKHSTGGVGDKTTIALGALVAANNVPVAKLSGRGLGHTGGTIDKLEAIPGFSADLSIEKFADQVNKINISLGGQTKDLAPADKKLYALRDVTATIDNISLIASSVMSKKLASGADRIVLDVKTGSGAFMKDIDEAFALGKAMVDIGNGVGKDTVAIITDMEQPLGNTIGNGIEVWEAIQLLKGKAPEDLLELCRYLGSYMLVLAEKVSTLEEGMKEIQEVIDNGKALEVFKTFIKCQGGEIHYIDKPELLYKTKYVYEYTAIKDGYIHQLDAELIGKCALTLGAGRLEKSTEIDHKVGLELQKKIGNYVKKGDIIVKIYYNEKRKLDEALKLFEKSLVLSDEFKAARKIIHGVVTKEGEKRLS